MCYNIYDCFSVSSCFICIFIWFVISSHKNIEKNVLIYSSTGISFSFNAYIDIEKEYKDTPNSMNCKS
ncbi:hypothetical protein L1987_18870 [Smallanthus sonchifolius]|uniref:Uncharacterized protein n=1 Tax=Smallanthus sonchifolius TaxID=185202 RepID=A0ACB9J2F4_9ASTR|nr:hypothetical protein L1987_18870 [Smallanthus sonchifolius]